MSGFKKTPKQEEATRLLASDATNVMLYGGGRAGKTFCAVRAIFIRAAKCKSRHVIVRLKFNHVKTSVWLDTIPKVLNLCFKNLGAQPVKSDYYYVLPNGSEVWIAGLDDSDRVEKILGKEYSTMYFNECSQIPYSSIAMAKTRLAEKSALKKKLYYDMNPPTKTHWSYWQFVKRVDPITQERVKENDFYSILMNPRDNLDNIDETYLEVLAQLPEKDRARFEFGEFIDASDGIAYYEFSRERHVQECEQIIGLPIKIGMDFNVNPMTAVLCHYVNGSFVIFDEVYLENSDTPRMCKHLNDSGYRRADVYPDSTGKNRKTTGFTDFDILNSNDFKVNLTTNPHVNDRVNNLNRLFKAGKIIISPKCKKLINDLEKVSWKDNKLDQKTDNMLTHISDALGYVTWALDNGLISNLPKDFKFTQRRGR